MAFSTPLLHFLLGPFLLCTIFLAIIESNAFQISKIKRPFPTSLKTLCNLTPYPNTCYNSLFSLMNQESSYDSISSSFNISIQAAKNDLIISYRTFGEGGAVSEVVNKVNHKRDRLALQSCRELIDLASYYLDRVRPTNESLTQVERRDDFRTWLSGVGSLLEFCKEEFKSAPFEVQRIVSESLDNSTKSVANSLTIVSTIGEQNPDKVGSSKQASRWPPSWLSTEDKILVDDPKSLVPNVIVAKDGSSKYTTISDALKVVPSNSNKKFLIYVKKGVYYENAQVARDKWNVVMYGDGMDQTIISSNRGNSSGFSVVESAALVVDGNGFMAMFMQFQNTVGAVSNQAVALRSTADKSVFYKCKMEGYQDTIFTAINRQFYRQCIISGTIDFIFGDAAVMIQNSDIFARKPLHGQSNVITANFKSQPASVSSISIQNCSVQTNVDLTGVRTFLGRPLRNYATTIFMESKLESLIDPQGWYIEKNAPSSNIYFAEYNNKGPGAVTTKRIQRNGVKPNLSSNEAKKFTVRSLITGAEWLPTMGVPYQPDL